MENSIVIEALVKAPIEKVWKFWNKPEHIVKWAFASDAWEAPSAENDLRVGGKFKTRMEAKDKSSGFDFGGTYTEIVTHSKIAYTMDDGRKVETNFVELPQGVKITTEFEAEKENPKEMQQQGWQAILNNFKKCVEA